MDIPVSILLLLCLLFIIIGGVIMLLLQYYVYVQLSVLPAESGEQRDINVKYSLPLDMQKNARTLKSNNMNTESGGGGGGGSGNLNDANVNTLMSINFVMQFLFHELKNSNRVRKWFYRKLSLELDELISKTTTGKLFDKLTIKELELGDQFPEIKALDVHNVTLDKTGGRIENLDLLLQIRYAGNFRIFIDADMVLGKKGSLMLQVRQLTGLARLQFTRDPYTHWSLSFLGDPEIDLAIESKYQGRQMQSNITSLISNQIRKAVRRKHTLPNYKLRYKPFFHKISHDEEMGDIDIQPNGVIEVKVSELSRLQYPTEIQDIYCTLTMASLAFVDVHQKDDRNVIVSLDIQIHKAKNQQIGIVFKQSSEHSVQIEAVLPNTPACKSNLRHGDVLVAIEGKRVTSIQHVAKVVKSLQTSIFNLRIERAIPGIIRNDAILEDLENYEDLGDLAKHGTGTEATSTTTSSLSSSSIPITIKGASSAINRSMERGTSSESSLSNTPTNSPKKSKLIVKAFKKTMNRENTDSQRSDDEKPKSKLRLPMKFDEKSTKSLSLDQQDIISSRSSGIGDGVNDVEHYHQHSTIDCPASSFIQMEDVSTFKLNAHTRFLNVCVYGKYAGASCLLGFINVPIQQIIAECCETSLTQCWKTYELNPPISNDMKSHTLSTQSGFNSNLCFGDVLFAFTWEGNPSIIMVETPSKHMDKIKKTSFLHERPEDSAYSDTISIKSNLSENSNSMQARSHTFIRTHFQRATQCDFCGKKIWLKDAVQCGECSFCCHKKCIVKCQNSTVCGPVDLMGASHSSASVASNNATPEFMVTEPSSTAFEATEASEELIMLTPSSDEPTDNKTITSPGLDVHRSSLTGFLAQGIKRVNSANNLAIPGIVCSIASGVGMTTSGSNTTHGKSLPPSPQHSPSRKSSIVSANLDPFEIVTIRLEELVDDLLSVTSEQIGAIVEPIIVAGKTDDVMTLAKTASRQLYCDMPINERVLKINILLSKLRLALDCETAIHTSLISNMKVDNESSKKPMSSVDKASISKSEENMQALSVIMLYLCTGLQNAQGVVLQ